MDWIEKITGVIASLLNFQGPDMNLTAGPMGSDDQFSTSKRIFFKSSVEVDQKSTHQDLLLKAYPSTNYLKASRSFQRHMDGVKNEKPIDILRRVCGNEKCADCGAPEPDWASLNLGILICIECSGVHCNLSVHISKVRSLTLDVKVWDNPVLAFFESMGNIFRNSIWDELLLSKSAFQADEMLTGSTKSNKTKLFHERKPSHDDPISVKEKFIHAKYAEKAFVRHLKDNNDLHLVQQQAWKGNMEDIPEGCSLLHLAWITADIGMVELLLQYGANVNVSEAKDQTPLHCCTMRGKSGVARILIMRGANGKAVDTEVKEEAEAEIRSQKMQLLKMTGKVYW